MRGFRVSKGRNDRQGFKICEIEFLGIIYFWEMFWRELGKLCLEKRRIL